MFISCYNKNLEELDERLLNQWKGYLATGKPSSIFDEFFNHQKNFMSPHIIRYGSVMNKKKTYRLVYELSWGTGFARGVKIYGTSFLVLSLTDGRIEKQNNWNKCLDNVESAKLYINSIKKDFKENFTF